MELCDWRPFSRIPTLAELNSSPYLPDLENITVGIRKGTRPVPFHIGSGPKEIISERLMPYKGLDLFLSNGHFRKAFLQACTTNYYVRVHAYFSPANLFLETLLLPVADNRGNPRYVIASLSEHSPTPPVIADSPVHVAYKSYYLKPEAA